MNRRAGILRPEKSVIFAAFIQFPPRPVLRWHPRVWSITWWGRFKRRKTKKQNKISSPPIFRDVGAQRRLVCLNGSFKIQRRRSCTWRQLKLIFVKFVAGPVVPRNQTPSTKSTAATFYLSGDESERQTEHLKTLNCAWIIRNKMYKKRRAALSYALQILLLLSAVLRLLCI